MVARAVSVISAWGSSPGGLYAFRIDAKGVQAIVQRNPSPGTVGNITPVYTTGKG